MYVQMKTIYFKNDYIDESCINAILENSGVIAFPTETVYGLGTYISNEEGINRIYELKNRPRDKALLVHMGKLEQIYMVAEEIPDEFFILARAFWPGPLTMILKKKKSVSSLISNSSTIGVRMPNHPITLKLLQNLKQPIVGTSANVSYQENPTSALDVSRNFHDKIDCIIDGGQCDFGVPSTIISLVDGNDILRKGSITKEQINRVLK